jgi:hypothetical protein
MKALTCVAARRRLDAFHDRELPVGEQIAVAQHLEWCDACAAVSAGIFAVGNALRAGAAVQPAPSADELAAFNGTVVNRLKAEREASFGARVRLMFEDMHLVYVGIGATAAATVCVMLMLGMIRFAADSRPDSLAAILNLMATPFECDSASDFPDVVACNARWVERFQRANESAEEDAVFTLDAMVTQKQGRLTNLAVLRASRGHEGSGQAKIIDGLLDAVSRARSATESPLLSGQMLRVTARETVRANKQPAIDLRLPAAKPAASMAIGLRGEIA